MSTAQGAHEPAVIWGLEPEKPEWLCSYIWYLDRVSWEAGASVSPSGLSTWLVWTSFHDRWISRENIQ